MMVIKERRKRLMTYQIILTTLKQNHELNFQRKSHLRIAMRKLKRVKILEVPPNYKPLYLLASSKTPKEVIRIWEH
jgi:hypothetical protein